MRLSLWTQFASNHSGLFTVYGVFKTIADAEKAEAELRQLLEAIAQWYVDNDVYWSESVTPPELQVAQKYGLNWSEPIDCVDSLADAQKMVLRLDRMVSIRNPDQTWHGKALFEDLLQRIGADLIAGFDLFNFEEGEGIPSYVKLDLSCQALNEADALTLADKWRQRFPAHIATIEQAGAALRMIKAFEPYADWLQVLREIEAYACTDVIYQWHKEIIEL